jgi:hypothetical protein
MTGVGDIERVEASVDDDVLRDGSVSLRGRPVSRRNRGGLRAAAFIHGTYSIRSPYHPTKASWYPNKNVVI